VPVLPVLVVPPPVGDVVGAGAGAGAGVAGALGGANKMGGVGTCHGVISVGPGTGNRVVGKRGGAVGVGATGVLGVVYITFGCWNPCGVSANEPIVIIKIASR
jgi:hypothetical protein